MKSSHNDAPAEADALGRMHLVREVCAVIRDCDPPKGVFSNTQVSDIGALAGLTRLQTLYHISTSGTPRSQSC